MDLRDLQGQGVPKMLRVSTKVDESDPRVKEDLHPCYAPGALAAAMPSLNPSPTSRRSSNASVTSIGIPATLRDVEPLEAPPMIVRPKQKSHP